MICNWRYRFGAGTFRTGRVSDWRRPREGENFGVIKGLGMTE